MAETTRLIGAVGIKVRPVTKGFREEIQDALRRLPDGEVKVTAEADTKKAERKLKEVSEDRTVHVRVGVTHDEIAAAKRKLESELKKFKDFKLPVTFTEQGLTEAIGKLDGLQKKSKVTMQINEDRAGYEAVLKKIKDLQREAKLVEIDPFNVDEDSLIREAAKYERLIDEATAPREVEITYSEDRDSIKRALERVEQELKQVKELTIPVTADEGNLANVRDSLQQMLDAAPVTMKYGQDKAGFEAILKKIATIRAEKIEKEITFHSDEKSLNDLEKEYTEKLDGLKEAAKIQIEVSNDTYQMRKTMAQIDGELKKLAKQEIDLELDPLKLTEKRIEIENALVDSAFELTYTNDVASLKAAKDKLDALLKQSTEQTVIVRADEESLRNAKTQLDGFIRDAEEKEIKLPIALSGLKTAAAQLAWGSRTRIVPFYVRINAKSLAVAEGVLKSLAGYNTLSSIGRSLENLATNFDTIAIKAAGIGTVLGGLVNTLGYAGTAALGIGDGMLRAVGLMAAAPAAITALTAGVLVNIAAWKNMKGAIDGNEEALAALPSAARDAAVALQGTWSEIQKPIQENYWDAMGTSLQDMVSAILPQVRDGLALTATHVGKFGAITADTIREIALTDQITNTLSNLAGFFDNASGAARPLTELISTLGLRGSEYLPQFGTWIANMTTKFNDFIQEADGMGRVNQWIEEGVQSLKDMWKIGGGVVDIIRGITGAAMDAGANDLSTVADNLERMGHTVNGEPFKSRLTTIFEGAREGASRLNTGVKNLGESFGRSAPFISDVLTLLGDLGGQVLTNIAGMFTRNTFKGGILDALTGLRDMMQDIEPSFSNLSNVIGTLGSTAGATFEGLGPLLNTVTGGLSDIADAMGEELPGVAALLLSQMDGTFSAIASVVVPVAEAIGNVLGVINDMPEGMQRMLVAATAFTVMRGQVSKLFDALGNTKAFNTLENAWRQQQIQAGVANASTQKFVAGTAAFSVARERVLGVGEAVRAVGTNATNATSYLGGMSKVIGGGLMTAGKGLLAMLGGPWGIALGAAAVGLSLYGQKQAEAKAKVQEHTSALNDQTGALTGVNAQIVANNIANDKGSAGIKTSSETLKALGKSVQDTSQTIIDGGAAYDNMISQIDKGIGAADQMASSVSEMGIPVKGNKDAWNEWTGQMGIATDAVSGLDLRALREQLVAEHESVERSVSMWATRNDSMEVAMGVSEGMAASIKVLGDAAADAEDRLSAYQDILDELNGTSKTAWEQQRELTESSSELAGFFNEVDEAGNRLNTGLIDLNTGFTIHTEAGGRLGEMLEDLQRQAFNAAESAYDSAGGMDNAAASAAAAAEATKPYRDQLQLLADQGLISQAEVDAVTRALLGVPGSTPFELTDQDSAIYVQKKVEGLTAKILATPDKRIEITEPLSPAIIKKLNDLGYVVKTLPNGNIEVTETGADSTGRKITGVANEYRFSVITAQADTAQANADLDAAANNPRTVSFFAKMMGQFQADGGILNGSLAQTFANGGLVKALGRMNNIHQYANGGFENHTAQIARPSPSAPIRIWAEPETSGEAYIPLSLAKRGRSTEILKQVAQQFGYTLQQNGVQQFADGGIVNGGSTGGGVAVNIGSYVTQKSDTPDDVARALMRRIKAQGAYSPLEAF